MNDQFYQFCNTFQCIRICLNYYSAICSYIIAEILNVWQPIEASHWSIPAGFAIGPSLSACLFTWVRVASLYFCCDVSSIAKQQFYQCLMQQKVLLVCKIYLFCIYFSLNNFNYPKKKYGNPICKTFADEIQHLLGFWSQMPRENEILIQVKRVERNSFNGNIFFLGMQTFVQDVYKILFCHLHENVNISILLI